MKCHAEALGYSIVVVIKMYLLSVAPSDTVETSSVQSGLNGVELFELLRTASSNSSK